jgi:predicted AAA+ superfamily ATPase
MDIERYNYLNEIIKFLDKPFIKILVGMRRTGKSKILFSLIDYLKETGVSENNIIYLDFENFENEYINSAHILNEEIIKRANNSEKFYLIFDEIQHVNE